MSRTAPSRLRPTHLLSLPDGVVVTDDEPGDAVWVTAPGGPTLRVPDRAAVVRETLSRLSLGPVSLENVPPLADAAWRWRHGDHRAGMCPEWRQVRAALVDLQPLLTHSLGADDGRSPHLSLVPVAPAPMFFAPPPAGPGPHVLAPTARVDGQPARSLVVAGASYRAELHRRDAAVLVTALDGGGTVDELAASVDSSSRTVGGIVSFLAAAGLVVEAG